MSWFLVAFAALMAISVVYALIDEFRGTCHRDDYEIPKGWESQIYHDLPNETHGEMDCSADLRSKKLDATADGDPNDAPAPKEMSSSLWYTIFFVSFVLLLTVLTRWRELEEWLYQAVDLTEQIRANPPIESIER